MNSKGFFLLDTLVALTIVLFACFQLFPIWMQIYQEREDVLKDRKAQQILYMNLQSYYRMKQVEETVLDENGFVEYVFTIQQSSAEKDYSKGCVSYKDSNQNTITICDEVQQRSGVYID